jgi:60 kDa SS-A/Ro ribonucleoprotein
MNKNIFNTKTNKADKINNAGGLAYSLSNEAALAQFAATGTFSDTYYVNADKQLEQVKYYASKVDPEFLAKVTVYSRESAFMKDMSAFLLATLMVRDLNLFKKIFNRVIDNGKMLRNFVQIVRSGQVGRKSFGSAPKRMICQWLESRNDLQLFNDSIGNNPSIKDIIKMVHPKPSNKNREALYAYLIDKDIKDRMDLLPQIIQDFEAFKKAPKDNRSIPAVNFQFLSAQDLSDREWVEIAKNMSWHTLRMNLNTLLRHNVFNHPEMINYVAAKLADENSIRKSKVFPYQLFTAFLFVDEKIPNKIKNALQDAMEIATTNIAKIKGKTVVAVDCSASMDMPVTGERSDATSKITCKNVASLIAACILRNSEETDVLRFTTKSERIYLNQRDTVITNAQKIGTISGGTAISSPLIQLNKEKVIADTIIIISDNESWADCSRNYNDTNLNTSLMEEWKKFKIRNPKAKLICIDLAPNDHTQAESDIDRLNIGGFSDSVFEVVAAFLENTNSKYFWVDKINQVQL